MKSPDVTIPHNTAEVMPETNRSLFLGASDIAAVLALSPYKTPVELWMEKTGRLKTEPTPEQQRRFARGHRLEPVIREMTMDRLRDMGIEARLIGVNQRYRDPEHPFLASEIDFELVLSGEMAINGNPVVFDKTKINVDAKSVTGFARKKWGEEGSEDVPIEYACQFQGGMMITGAQLTLVAALRSFDDVEFFWQVRDDEIINGMRPKLVDFWQRCVVGDVAPDPVDVFDVLRLYPKDNKQAKAATDEIAELVKQYATINKEISTREKEREAMKFEIGEFISPFSELTFDGKTIATWKAQDSSRLSQDALAEAELYLKDAQTGEYKLIVDPVAHFKRTSTTRVLRTKA